MPMWSSTLAIPKLAAVADFVCRPMPGTAKKTELAEQLAALQCALDLRNSEFLALEQDRGELSTALAARISKLNSAMDRIAKLEAKLDEMSEVQRMRRDAESAGEVVRKWGVQAEPAGALSAASRRALRERGSFAEVAGAVQEQADRRLPGRWAAVVGDHPPAGCWGASGEYLILKFGDLYINVFRT